jgi:hypothetical protein
MPELDVAVAELEVQVRIPALLHVALAAAMARD